MRWYFYLLLGLLGLTLALTTGWFQTSPGYMDADYYFAGGLRLAQGHGFTETILWNYLDNPTALPHPAFSYWMPLASIIAAAGMVATGSTHFNAARIGFLLIAALIPPLTAYLGYKVTSRQNLSLTAGLFAIFSGYYAPYASVTDTFGIYMLLGAMFFILLSFGLETTSRRKLFLIMGFLGLVAGLAHFSRADGFIWLFSALLAVLLLPSWPLKTKFLLVALVIFGYAIVMAPWFARNINVLGTPLAPGGNHALWLTSYDQTYAYPASQLSFSSWISSGFKSIVAGRIDALKWNLQTTWAVQGVIFLLPFILVGIWAYRRDVRVQVGLVAWGITFLFMTLLFPFAGARGSFLHSGAALQPLWWVLAPIGIEKTILWAAEKRKWRTGEALRVFTAGFIGIAVLLTGLIFYNRVFSGRGWGSEAVRYQQVEEFIKQSGAGSDEIVMVGNTPGYFVLSGRPAIAIPNEGLATVIDVAHKFNAKYLILEDNGVPKPLLGVLNNPSDFPQINYLGEINGAKIYAIP
jgi:hypothetical protein